MPKVRLSSGTIGTMRGPTFLSRNSVVRMRTNAIVVEISRPSPVACNSASKVLSGGNFERRDRAAAGGKRSAERGAALLQIFSLRSALRQFEERHVVQLFVGQRDVEAVAERLQGVLADLLGLMGDHLPFAGFAHAVALDGLGEDDGRLALVIGRRLIGRVDLDRVVAAAGQRPDLVVGPVLDHFGRLGMAAEEILADIGAVLRLEILVFAVDAFVHQLAQLAVLVLARAARPSPCPTGI